MDVGEWKREQNFHEKHYLFCGGSHSKEEIHIRISMMEGLPVVLLLFVPIDIQPYFNSSPNPTSFVDPLFIILRNCPFLGNSVLLAYCLIGSRLHPASNATYSFALWISFSLQNSWKIGKYFFISVTSKNLRPGEMSAFLDLLAASLLSFQLSNKMSIFMVDDDELDIHDFMKHPLVVV